MPELNQEHQSRQLDIVYDAVGRVKESLGGGAGIDVKDLPRVPALVVALHSPEETDAIAVAIEEKRGSGGELSWDESAIARGVNALDFQAEKEGSLRTMIAALGGAALSGALSLMGGAISHNEILAAASPILTIVGGAAAGAGAEVANRLTFGSRRQEFARKEDARLVELR